MPPSLNTSRMDDRVQQQTLGVDKDVSFLTLDQFARIEPMGINTGPPFQRSSRSGCR
jgi:hypothetical protein